MKKTTLFLALALATVPSIWAKQISGTVKIDGKAAAGVVVSDGVNVVSTDAKGKYSFESTDRQHVFVSVPSGVEMPLAADGQPEFFATITPEGAKQKIDFNLKSAPVPDEWTLLALADVQIGYPEDLRDLTTKVMPQLADSMDVYTGTVYGISLGDIVWNNTEYYGKYRQQIARMGIPVFSVIGNHDHNEITKGDKASDLEFRNGLGPTYYSVNIGDAHLVALDDILYSGLRGRNDYRECITDEQLDWLRRDLEFVPKDKLLFISMHAPTSRRSHPDYLMESSEKLFDIVKDFENVQILAGHRHYNYTVDIAPNIRETSFGAFNGAFWYPINNDGSPRGYGVLKIKGNKIADKYYKGFATPRDYQIKLYAPADAVLWQKDAKPGDAYDKILANIWCWHYDWTVEVSEDGGAWQTLTADDRAPLPAVDPDIIKQLDKGTKCLNANHRGSRPTPNTDHMFLYRPADNWQKVTFRATDPHGNIYTASITNK